MEQSCSIQLGPLVLINEGSALVYLLYIHRHHVRIWLLCSIYL